MGGGGGGRHQRVQKDQRRWVGESGESCSRNIDINSYSEGLKPGSEACEKAAAVLEEEEEEEPKWKTVLEAVKAYMEVKGAKGDPCARGALKFMETASWFLRKNI